MKKIILGVTGSIAAYKAADIAARVVHDGVDVHVVMTKAATEFITPLTMQALTRNRVYTDVLQEGDPSRIVHVELPASVDLMAIAPATANTIAQLAQGTAGNMLTAMALAAWELPKLIAPAMNTRMYQSPPVQENLDILQRRGWKIIEPRESRLACGEVGKGALAETGAILAEILSVLKV